LISELLYVISKYWPFLLEGLKTAFIITLTSYAIGLAGGICIAIARTFLHKALKIIMHIYVELFRGTPMLIQLFFVYYALPEVGVKFDPVLSAVIAIGLNSAAYQSEYIRSALSSIPYSEIEAAYLLGLTKLSTMLYIALPQAIRIAIPTLTNEAIYLFKYSSIAYFVTAPELMYMGKLIATRTFLYVEVYTVLAIIYVAFSIVLSGVARYIERRLQIPGYIV
jgi:polar amino acid transport system permease protein